MFPLKYMFLFTLDKKNNNFGLNMLVENWIRVSHENLVVVIFCWVTHINMQSSRLEKMHVLAFTVMCLQDS